MGSIAFSDCPRAGTNHCPVFIYNDAPAHRAAQRGRCYSRCRQHDIVPVFDSAATVGTARGVRVLNGQKGLHLARRCEEQRAAATRFRERHTSL
jgi:hypothetical protein